jgi:hypothetical protein
MILAVVCPCAGLVSEARRMSISSVPFPAEQVHSVRIAGSEAAARSRMRSPQK